MTKHPHITASSLIVAATISVALPAPGNAQDAGAAAAPEPALAAAAPEASLAVLPPEAGDIVVTARKRRETLRSVPASISALSGETLASRQIRTVEDLSRATPGVSFQSGGGPGTDNIQVRGISSTSGNATVGIYLDEIAITLPNVYNGAIEPAFIDLARIEVLRGPQGTLFGASSMGGSLRFISNAPSLTDLGGSANTSLSGTKHGGFNHQEQATLNVPIVEDRVAVRIAGSIERNSGYIDNYDDAGNKLNDGTNADTIKAVRASVLIKPGSGWSITPSVFYQDQNVRDSSVFYTDLGKYQQSKKVREPSRIKLVVAGLTVEKELGFATLTSVSGYFRHTFDRTIDGTFYNSEYLGYLADSNPPFGLANRGSAIGNLPGPEYTNTVTRQFSQEVRLTSNAAAAGGQRFSWIVGLYASDQKIRRADNAYVVGLNQTFRDLYGIPPEQSDVFPGSAFPDDSVALATLGNRDRQYAAFGDATLALTPRLKLTAGVRYTHARETSSLATTGYFAGSGPPVYTTDAKFNAATPKISLSYDASRDITVYGLAARGFRVGGATPYIPPDICGADLADIGLTTVPRSFKSDKLWNYEVGAKGRVLGGRLTFNGALFLIDWSGIQQTLGLPTCGYSVVTNAGDARSYGGELEVRAELTPDLFAHASLGTVHSKLTSASTDFGPRAGQHTLNAPEWTLAFGLDYRHVLPSQATLFGHVLNAWTGRSYGSYNVADPDYVRPVYNTVNADVGVALGRLEISVFAKNLLNSKKIIQRPSILFVAEGYTLRPLTAGGRVSYRF